MKKLKLTIVIPTRNRLALLTKTLVSLKKNDFFFREVIIVDSYDKEEKKKIVAIISLKFYKSSF